MPSSSSTYVICLTGGPGAGKSTALGPLKAHLERHGFRVLVAPESATPILNAVGGYDRAWANDHRHVEFQSVLLAAQRAQEAHLRRLAALRSEPTILLLDRGAVDGKAFTTEPQWAEVLAASGTTEAELLQAYDLVVHLVTPAAEPGYEHLYAHGPGSTNPARFHDGPAAAAADERGRAAYACHPAFRLVRNRATWAAKLAAVTDAVDGFLRRRGALASETDCAMADADAFLATCGLRPDSDVPDLEDLDSAAEGTASSGDEDTDDAGAGGAAPVPLDVLRARLRQLQRVRRRRRAAQARQAAAASGSLWFAFTDDASDDGDDCDADDESDGDDLEDVDPGRDWPADAIPGYWRNVDGGRLLVPKATPTLVRPPREAYSKPRRQRGPTLPTPLNVDVMEADLPDYYDPAAFTILREGARLGCLRERLVPVDLPNHGSARANARKIDETVTADLAGYAPDDPFIADAKPSATAAVKVAPLGAVSKKFSSKVRRIDDESFGAASLNSAILELPGLRLSTVHDVRAAAYRILFRGGRQVAKGRLVKLDVDAGYKVVNVFGLDRPLCGFAWRGRRYMHLKLPFGCRSAVVTYARVVTNPTTLMLNLLSRFPIGESQAKFDAACAAIRRGEVDLAAAQRYEAFGYVDDFAGVCAEGHAAECWFVFRALFRRWGIPLAPEKLKREGPPTESKVWLGLRFTLGDDPTISLDADRIDKLRGFLAIALRQARTGRRPKRRRFRREGGAVVRERAFAGLWSRKSYAQVVGVLLHAQTVIPVLRLWCNALLADLRVAPTLPSADSVVELEMARTLLARSNGVPLECSLQLPVPPGRDVSFHVDAATTLGFGAWARRGSVVYFMHGLWDERERRVDVNVLEAAALYLACTAFSGRRLMGNMRVGMTFRHASTANAVSARFRAHSDNSATVTLLTSGRSRSTKSIAVAKLLHLHLARNRIAIDAKWIPGETANGGADDLSRDRVAHFCKRMRSRGLDCVLVQVPVSIRRNLRTLLHG